MVNDNKFQWDYQTAGDLMLRSREIAEVCEQAAEKMTRSTGMTYKTGRTSQRVVVEPEGRDEE